MDLSVHGPVPVVYCKTPETLQLCVEALAQSSAFSIDLEFDSNRYGYGVTPSLIQAATPRACYVVDLLAGLDVSALYALLANERIQKLVHAPGEDLRLLHRLGCFPKNLFDTEVVARLLNYEQTSQAVLLEKKLGIVLNKGQQRSNWLLRPLSEAQLQYAASDVIWLHSLKQQLVAEAEEKGLMPFVQEEQALLSETIYLPADPDNFLKPADRLALSPWQQWMTNEMLRYRDDLARRIGRPAYQVMSEEVARDLALGHLLPRDVINNTAVHPRYRTPRFANELTAYLGRSKESAASQGLSHQKPRRQRPAPAEEALRRKAAADRERLFLPIQQTLKDRFGVYATQLLMSNKFMGDLLNGTVTLSNLRPHYRQVLLLEAAEKLGLDLGDYGAKPSLRKL